MRISLLDRSLYYKSLMILIRQDRQIHDEEKKMMLSIGKMLGFDPKFCTKTMEDSWTITTSSMHRLFSRKLILPFVLSETD